MLEVVVLGPEAFLFEGKAARVILPGEKGVFEICPFHRPLISRLLPGVLIIDKESIPIQKGVVKVDRNKVTAIVEPT